MTEKKVKCKFNKNFYVVKTSCSKKILNTNINKKNNFFLSSFFFKYKNL